MAPQAGWIVRRVVDASRAAWRSRSVLRKRAGCGLSPQRSNPWQSPGPRTRQGELQPATTSRVLPLLGSTLHKVPDAEKGANRPGSYFCELGMHRRWVSQIPLQYLMAMWTGVSIEMIAKLDATARTFFPKHNSAKST